MIHQKSGSFPNKEKIVIHSDMLHYSTKYLCQVWSDTQNCGGGTKVTHFFMSSDRTHSAFPFGGSATYCRLKILTNFVAQSNFYEKHLCKRGRDRLTFVQ